MSNLTKSRSTQIDSEQIARDVEDARKNCPPTPAPGPWRFENGNILAGETVDTPRGKCTKIVARVMGDCLDDHKANGCLLAAAPELREALEGVMQQLDRGNYYGTGRTEGAVPFINLARKALANSRVPSKKTRLQ